MMMVHSLTANRRTLAAGVAAVTGLWIVRCLFQEWNRKRSLRAKIAKFHDEERQRRAEIEARLVGLSVEEARKITALPLDKLVAKLNKGELTARQVLHAFQRVALAIDGDVNAVTQFMADAEELAVSLDLLPPSYRRPLHGIPVSVKECFFVKGTETTCGYSQYLGRCVDEETMPLIQFLKGLGCIPFAKTNIPQGLMSFDSRNPIYGQTKHPLDRTKSPGGSSSGEGALMAAGASIIGLGNDAGGSVRCPAAWCGVYCLKPSSTRTIVDGDFMCSFDHRVLSKDFLSNAFYARDVDTLVKINRLLYSKETFERFPLSTLTPVPFRDVLYESKEPLTITYCDFDGIMELTPSAKRVMFEAKHRLETAGHRLIPWPDVAMLKEAYLIYCQQLVCDGMPDFMRDAREDIEIAYANQLFYQILVLPGWMMPVFQALAGLFMGPLAYEVLGAMKRAKTPHDMNLIDKKIVEFRRKFHRRFVDYKFDACLWPAMPFPALHLNAPREVSSALSNLLLFNLLNWPAGICPFGKYTDEDAARLIEEFPQDKRLKRDHYHCMAKRFLTESPSIGFPMAVQVSAPQFNEEVVLRLMKELA